MIDSQGGAIAKNAEHWRQLSVEWTKRSQFAAEWMQDSRCVADVGCGLMTLEQYLPRSTRYIPIDIVPRDSRTIIVDLNRDRIPKLECDTVAMLGVLEYIEDVPTVLAQLTKFKHAILNYNHFSINDILWKLRLREKRVTWVNRYTAKEIRHLINSAGLKIIRRRRIRIGENIYEVRPV